VRRVLDLIRSIPDLVVAIIFITAVGLGPFAGVMAMMFNTGGVLAKLFSEAVESIDKGPVEGVRATGAGRLQEIVWGVIPRSRRCGPGTPSTASNRTAAPPRCWG
jgi:phosphonate transport system permease protein